MMLLPGDIIFTASTGILSDLIKYFQRSKGEPASRVAHVGIISTIGTPAQARVIESLLQGTVERKLSAYGRGYESVCIYRNYALSDADRIGIVNRARYYVGKKYGFTKILAHAGDYLLGGRYYFRRWAKSDNYPICSWVVAHAYAYIAARFADIEPDYVQPDDIWDTVTHDINWRWVGNI
jgi:hypothetical protein